MSRQAICTTRLTDTRRTTRSSASPTRWSTAASVRGWWPGANRSDAKNAPRIVTTTTGRVRCRPSAIPQATLLVVGLAPAAHGGNRTGRMFTGDRSGDWLFGALYRAGYANQPTSLRRDDGLAARRRVHQRLRALRAARQQADARGTRHVPAVPRARAAAAAAAVRVIVCLGKFAYDGIAQLLQLKRRPAFGHGVEARAARRAHASSARSTRRQQNTFTGKLTVPMFDAIFAAPARELS